MSLSQRFLRLSRPLFRASIRPFHTQNLRQFSSLGNSNSTNSITTVTLPIQSDSYPHRAQWSQSQLHSLPKHNLEILVFPLLQDNYGFLLHHKNRVIAIDLPENCSEEYCERAKESFNSNITDILITHWHWDHLGGWPALKQNNFALNAEQKPRLFGSEMEMKSMEKYAERSDFDCLFNDKDNVTIGDLDFLIRHLPGHTSGHIGYFLKDQKDHKDISAAFIGDVLFPMGCGRLFEGSFRDGYESMSKVRDLLNCNIDSNRSNDSNSESALVFCAHEYASDSAQFHLGHLYGKELRKLRNVDTNRDSYYITGPPGTNNESNAESDDHDNVTNSDSFQSILQRSLTIAGMRSINVPTTPFRLSDDIESNSFLTETNPDKWQQLREARNKYKIVRPWPEEIKADSEESSKLSGFVNAKDILN